MAQAGSGERFTLANLIIAIAAFAVLFTGATTFARSWLSSASSNAGAYSTAAEREGEIRRTNLTQIARCETPLGTTVRFTFANTGQASLHSFADWDLTVFYKTGSGHEARRLTYTDDTSPSANQWTVSQITQPNGQAEVVERDIINTGEEATVIAELSPGAWADAANKLALATEKCKSQEVNL